MDYLQVEIGKQYSNEGIEVIVNEITMARLCYFTCVESGYKGSCFESYLNDSNLHPTTLDNFDKVLELNGWDNQYNSFYEFRKDGYFIEITKHNLLFGILGDESLLHMNRNKFEYFIQCIELKIGKLKQLPKE